MGRHRPPIDWLDPHFGVDNLAGVDEAGRGALAGPVVAAAVILPPDVRLDFLRDSKQLTANRRNILRQQIESQALAWSVSYIGSSEIDRINIFQASLLAMQKAVQELSLQVDLIVVDGRFTIPGIELAQHALVRGDQRVQAVAAASVLAKTYRDEYMCRLHEDYPTYSWKDNKGYPTAAHRFQIKRFGPSPHHRLSFRLF